MRRYIASYRTRSNTTSTSQVQTQFLTELTQQAQAILTQMTQQFAEDLQSQSAQMLSNLASSNLTGEGSLSSLLGAGEDGSAADDAEVADASADVSGYSGLSQLLATGARYLVSRPRTSTSTQETTRSQDAATSFKVSRSQQLAEAGITLGKGDKNL